VVDIVVGGNENKFSLNVIKS